MSEHVQGSAALHNSTEESESQRIGRLGLHHNAALRGLVVTVQQRVAWAIERHAVDRARYMDLLLAATNSLKVGNGLDPATQMGPVVDQDQLNTDLSYIEIAKNEGLNLIA